MDLGFSRRKRARKANEADRLTYMKLIAEIAAAQENSITARAQSEIGLKARNAKTAEMGSFHPATAALLRDEKE